MLVLQRNNFLLNLKHIHYINCPLFIFGGGSYLLVSNVDHLEPPHEEKLHVSADSGIPIIFVLGAWSILTLLHFLFLKHIKGLNTTYKLSNALVESILSGMGSPSNDSLNKELRKKVQDLEYAINERNEEL